MDPRVPQGSQDTGQGQPAIREAALFGLCPACGSRTLFAGISRFAGRCRVCRLEFSRFNVDDGPAAFLTLIVGAMVVGLALWLEVSVGPPVWVHALLWIPLIIGLTLVGLRIAKAALLASEYRHSAREAGRNEP